MHNLQFTIHNYFLLARGCEFVECVFTRVLCLVLELRELYR